MPITVWSLMVFASLVMSGAPFIVLAGGILGHQLAPSDSLHTLPIAVFVVGAAVSVYPAVRLMGVWGRKAVFGAACLLMMGGALLGASGVHHAQFWVLCGASGLLGAAQAVFAQVRFAAAELVPVGEAGRATARIMLSGLVAAVVGPELSTAGLLVSPSPFLGGFLLLGVLGTLAWVLLFFTYSNYVPASSPQKEASSNGSYWHHPVFWMSVVSAALAYGVMSLIMTATPVNMHIHHEFDLTSTKQVIQAHIFAMFLPSFFSGRLIARFGERTIILLGLACYSLTVAIGLGGASFLHFGGALILLGFGWNFMFVAATASLMKVSQSDDPYRVQAINDVCVVTCQAIAALGAGWLLNLWGWHWLLWVCVPLLAGCATLVVWAKPAPPPEATDSQTVRPVS